MDLAEIKGKSWWSAEDITWLIAKVEKLDKENNRQSDALGQINAVCVATYPDCSGTPLAEMVRRLASDLTLSRAEGRREGETDLICYMIDNYEGFEVTEEMLQRAYSDYLKWQATR